MTTPTLKLYPSAPLEIETEYLEDRLEKKLNNVCSFNNSSNINKK